MKLTKQQLKEMIREELSNVNEDMDDYMMGLVAIEPNQYTSGQKNTISKLSKILLPAKFHRLYKSEDDNTYGNIIVFKYKSVPTFELEVSEIITLGKLPIASIRLLPTKEIYVELDKGV